MYYFLPRLLPPSLEALTPLALDLRWTWSHASDALWRKLDSELWERTRSPWAILQNVPQQRLEALAGEPAFREELSRVVKEHQQYLDESGWCGEVHPDSRIKTIAYFSMEFGLSEAFPLYAGGLGILAGDYLKTASDLGIPVVGVGLLYQEGYFRQVLDASGRQREAYPYNDPTSLPIQPVIGPSGAWLCIDLPLPGRALRLRVWQTNVGRVRLYLLDSNDLLNGAGDRGITAKLYGGGVEMRLLQELALGIGGWATLEKLGIEPEVCHFNEGHAAFAVLERAREFMRKEGTSFWEAWWATRAGNVFTTHTPVAVGFDLFPPDLIRRYFRDYAGELHIPVADLLALGRRNGADEAEPFNMAHLALRGCAKANGVSRLHGEVSRRLFRDLYPGWPEREVPIGHVTNGVHVPSWDSSWADRAWTRACGKGRWLGTVEGLKAAISAIDDEQLWRLAAEERRDLIRYARERLTWQLGQRGAPPEIVKEATQVLDPNVLTLGFARRFTGFKRPNLLLHDPDRLARLLLDHKNPVQIIIAGKAHPEDEEGKKLIQAWFEFVARPDVRARAVFLEDYDMALAQQMVQGVDVWLNTPRRPWEACGTSGMKVLVNGGINISTLDGWWAEAYFPEGGWAIDTAPRLDVDCDTLDAAELYRVLEREVVPLFYERDATGIPVSWVRRMRASISELAPAFSSNRMLREYWEEFYRPCAEAFRRRSNDQGRVAKELSAWHARLAAHWHEIHFGAIDVQQAANEWRYSVAVYLGEIAPEWVRVELYAEAASNEEPVRQTMTRGESIVGAVNGYIYRADVASTRPDEHFTPRVVARHPEASTPIESLFVSWQR